MEASMEVPAHRGVWHPWAPLGRSWRRFRRRPRAMQVRTALIVIAIVVGLVAWLVFAPSGSPGGAGSAGAAEPALHSSSTATPPSQASTSTRGVSKTEINVVFPVVAINSVAGQLGFAEDKEYNEQTAAIHLYVNQINNAGGINGRKINPMIVSFDPTNDANMQSLCEQWTQGNPAVFAVVDGIGTWIGDQPALRDPAGPHPVDQRLVHDDELDQPRLAVPVVDRRRHGAGAGGDRPVGHQLGPPGSRQEGRRGRLGPGGRPGRAQRLLAAGPEEGGHHARRSRRWPATPTRPRPPTRTRSWPSSASRPPASSPSSRCCPRTPSSPTSPRRRRSSTSPSSS